MRTQQGPVIYTTHLTGLTVGPWLSQGILQSGQTTARTDSVPSARPASGTFGVGFPRGDSVRQHGDAVLLARGEGATPALEALAGGDALIPVQGQQSWATGINSLDLEAGPGDATLYCVCTKLGLNVPHNVVGRLMRSYSTSTPDQCAMLHCGVCVEASKRGPRPVAKSWSVHRGEKIC